MKKLLIGILLLSQTTLFGQSIEKQMKVALKIHDNATTFEEELKSAQSLAAISDANQDMWLPAYWASFVYSQAGNATQSDKLKYFNTAFEYYQRAESQKEKLTQEEKGHLMALKALLSSLLQTPYFIQGNSEKGMEYVSMQVDAFKEGLTYAPAQPTMLVLLGISQIGAGFRSQPDNDLMKIAAGKALLLQAKSMYEKMEAGDELVPDRWNQGWIDFWLSRANQ